MKRKPSLLVSQTYEVQQSRNAHHEVWRSQRKYINDSLPVVSEEDQLNKVEQPAQDSTVKLSTQTVSLEILRIKQEYSQKATTEPKTMTVSFENFTQTQNLSFTSSVVALLIAASAVVMWYYSN